MLRVPAPLRRSPGHAALATADRSGVAGEVLGADHLFANGAFVCLSHAQKLSAKGFAYQQIILHHPGGMREKGRFYWGFCAKKKL
jgi:hypothetical protein